MRLARAQLPCEFFLRYVQSLKQRRKFNVSRHNELILTRPRKNNLQHAIATLSEIDRDLAAILDGRPPTQEAPHGNN